MDLLLQWGQLHSLTPLGFTPPGHGKLCALFSMLVCWTSQDTSDTYNPDVDALWTCKSASHDEDVAIYDLALHLYEDNVQDDGAFRHKFTQFVSQHVSSRLPQKF